MNNSITDNENLTINPETGEAVETAPEAAQSKENLLFFSAKQWSVSKDCNNTKGSRTFISDPFGDFTEAWLLGDWSWNWSQIETRDMILERNTDYIFTFWFNGGENDQNDEACQFEVVFDNDLENRSIYKLNRSYIKPVRHYNGWFLYRLPFNTGDASYTKLRFVQMRAYCAIIPAKPLDAYKDLPESLPQANVPQRHNIIFGDEGFPHNSWWSKFVFGENNAVNAPNNFGNTNSFTNVNGFRNVGETLESTILSNMDIDEIISNVVGEISDEIDEDDIADRIRSEIDVEAIKQNIIDSIKSNLK